MKRWLNTLTGRTERRIDDLGNKVLREYDNQASKFLGLGRNSSKAKLKKHQLHRLDNLKSKAKKQRRTSAGVLIGGAGIGGGTYAYHKTKDKTKSQKLKAKLVDKADMIYRRGQDDYQNRILQDPQFPLPVKIKMLESQGVIKQASLKGMFSLSNIKAAKGKRDNIGKKLSDLSQSKGSEKEIARLNKNWDKEQSKVVKERWKSLGAYGTLAGAGLYGNKKLKESKKSK